MNEKQEGNDKGKVSKMKREGDKPVRVLVESIFEGYLYQEEYWKYSNDI